MGDRRMASRDGRRRSRNARRARGRRPGSSPLYLGLLAFVAACSGDPPEAREPSASAGRQEDRGAEAPAPKSPRLQRALDAARSAGDDDLRAVLTGDGELAVPAVESDESRFSDPDSPIGPEVAILEAVRRGGKDWEAFLEGLARADSDRGADLTSLTCLRRVQGLPDPLEVSVEPAGSLEVTWPEMPALRIVLRNREAGGPGFSIGPENSYRGGFLRAFRFDVVRADGTLVPGRQRWGDFGGVLSWTDLKAGEKWERGFDMRDYVSPLECGAYTVRAQYGEDSMFSNAKDLRGRVYYSSEPFLLHVRPRRITLTEAEDEAVRVSFRSLSDAGPIRFVVGTPVEQHPDFIAAESPEGAILRAGWRAVPALLDALETPDLTPRRRAWALALLYGISGTIDPRPQSVFGASEPVEEELDQDAEIVEGGLGGSGMRASTLGESSYEEAAWECLVGGPHSGLGGQGGPFVLTEAGGGGDPSRIGQAWLVGRWRKARKFLEIAIR